MRPRLSPCLYLGSLLVSLGAGHASATDPKPDAGQAEFFEKKVRPLLAENCFQCHGPEKQRGGLRLASRDGLMKGGDSGPAVVAGQPDKSRLVEAIGYGKEDLRMPPKGKLSDEQVAVLTAWVKMDAPWPEVASAVRP